MSVFITYFSTLFKIINENNNTHNYNIIIQNNNNFVSVNHYFMSGIFNGFYLIK